MRQGRILAGKYRLVSKLTEGGMGMVWRAEHVELGSPAAVKLLDPTIADSSEALARFKREAQSAASLRCTNIVQIFDFGVDENMPYIAMELLRGKSLAEKLRAERQLSPVDTAAVLSQVARAAAWAHSQGIVHRDLKPGNIFLSEDADDIVVKLLDFGIAKPVHMDLSETPVTLTGAIMGTPQYMSPEQASGKKLVDHRTDIWSFGIIAFECIIGRHAFHADTLGGLVLAICTEPLPKPSDFAQVPPGFDEWFAQAAHRDLDKRFPTITEAADTLRFICGVESTGNHRMSAYDGTLEGEVRAISTPSRGCQLRPWTRVAPRPTRRQRRHCPISYPAPAALRRFGYLVFWSSRERRLARLCGFGILRPKRARPRQAHHRRHRPALRCDCYPRLRQAPQLNRAALTVLRPASHPPPRVTSNPGENPRVCHPSPKIRRILPLACQPRLVQRSRVPHRRPQTARIVTPE